MSTITEEYNEWAYNNGMPSWDFSPWGYRNHCYLIGKIDLFNIFMKLLSLRASDWLRSPCVQK